jgi:hypothetical protein
MVNALTNRETISISITRGRRCMNNLLFPSNELIPINHIIGVYAGGNFAVKMIFQIRIGIIGR